MLTKSMHQPAGHHREDRRRRGRDVREAHVAARRGARDDVGHQRPVDGEERASRGAEERRTDDRDRDCGRHGRSARPGDPIAQARVDHRLAADPVRNAGARHDRDAGSPTTRTTGDRMRHRWPPSRRRPCVCFRYVIRRSSRASRRPSGRTGATATSQTYDRSRRMSVPHVSPAIETPRPAVRGPSAAGPARRGGRRATIVISSTIATAKIANSMRPTMRRPAITARKPVTLPRICISPTIALASPTCCVGDEVRDVALERAAGDVRAEREQDRERGEREDGVAPSRSRPGTRGRAASRSRCTACGGPSGVIV